MPTRVPVIIAGIDCLSGVTTWAARLRAALTDHPRYDVKLLYIGLGEPAGYDLCVPTVEAAHQLVREMAPAILLPNYTWPLFLAGFEKGIYCVGMCHADSDEQYYRPLSWYEPTISQFIAVSAECADRLSKKIPFRSEDITMLPYGIDVPHAVSRDYQTDPLRLVYAGRVTQLQKRVWDFVPLVEHLLKAEIRFEFDIVGDGDELEYLKTEMQARAPAGYVRFHGRIPHSEMSGVWASHDAFIQVSDFEGTSVSMLESMAHGVVPVVTAASSGIVGVIHPEENGFVVPIGDMAAMARVLVRLANDHASLASAGHGARQTAQAYSMESYAERFTRLLDQVATVGQEVDNLSFYKRYGMFADSHPLLKQRQLIVHQQEQITRLQRGAVKRFLDVGYDRLLPAKMRRYLTKRRA